MNQYDIWEINILQKCVFNRVAEMFLRKFIFFIHLIEESIFYQKLFNLKLVEQTIIFLNTPFQMIVLYCIVRDFTSQEALSWHKQ